MLGSHNASQAIHCLFSDLRKESVIRNDCQASHTPAKKMHYFWIKLSDEMLDHQH